LTLLNEYWLFYDILKQRFLMYSSENSFLKLWRIQKLKKKILVAHKSREDIDCLSQPCKKKGYGSLASLGYRAQILKNTAIKKGFSICLLVVVTCVLDIDVELVLDVVVVGT
jgi:hypothetical protein